MCGLDVVAITSLSEGAGDMSILARVRVVVPVEKRAEVVRTLRSLVEPTRVEPGCLGCHLSRDVQDENVLNYLEEWERQEDLNRRLKSDEYRKLLAVIDESQDEPQIRFDTIAHTEGLEAVRAARLGPTEPSD